MAKKTSTGKSGSGSQSDKSPGGKSGEGGESTESEENEEEEEEESSEESESSEDESGDDKGKEGKGGKSKELDLSALPQETQDYIRKLRRESAKYRTKATNLETNYNTLSSRVKKLAGGKEEEELSVEDQAAQLEAGYGAATFDNAILNAAVENGVGKSGLKYFRFLVSERAAELSEGEELSEEDLADIAEEAAKATGGKGGTKTSVTGDDERGAGGKGGSRGPGKSGKVSLDQFVKMTVYEKSELQKANPDLYVALFKEAREKRKFV